MRSDDPIAFFLTWVTYGTWLPGDERGWVEYQRGWRLPNQSLEAASQICLNEEALLLTDAQRKAVEQQIAENCDLRGWRLHAVNCRTNHVHVVVTAPHTRPKKTRLDLKAYATRCLKAFDETRKHWWAERGSIRWVFTDEDLEAAVTYVLQAQSRKSVA